MIDIGDEESTQEYADRKERELMDMMYSVERYTQEVVARAISDSIDAHILNEVMTNPPSYSEEGKRILESLRLRDQCPHDAQYTEDMIEEIKEALDKNE